MSQELKMYYEQDADLNLLKNKKIAILGYGSQGRPQSLNLKDSGLDVIVAQRPGSIHYENAIKDGFKPVSIQEAVKQADFIQMMLPDETQKQIWEKDILPNIKKGAILSFAHGFNIRYGQIVPPKNIDVIMISPKGVGPKVRMQYEANYGVPCLIAIQQDVSGKAKDYALSYAKAIGGTRVGVLETTFKEETETDLFGEQAVLCGGVVELVSAAFDTLVKKGYQPEMAFFECFYELKLITDLLFDRGIAQTNAAISNTAEYGEYVSGKKIITEQTRKAMDDILNKIQSGEFAKQWINESLAGTPNLLKCRKEMAERQIEKIGQNLRNMMKKVTK